MPAPKPVPKPAAAPTLDVTGRPLRLRDVDLDTFLRPRSVAVIGASDRPGRPNTLMTQALKEFSDKYGASFHPVHPSAETVFGAPVARTIAEVPGPVDLVAILTGAAVDTFEEVQAAGARFAVIFAAGFSEVGKDGERLEARLRALVESGDTRLLGPNTNLNAFSEFRADLTGPALALITQSGHQGRPIFQGQEIGSACPTGPPPATRSTSSSPTSPATSPTSPRWAWSAPTSRASRTVEPSCSRPTTRRACASRS